MIDPRACPQSDLSHNAGQVDCSRHSALTKATKRLSKFHQLEVLLAGHGEACENCVAGASNGCLHAGIAQLVEQLICNQQVIGSSPIAGSLNDSNLRLKLIGG